MLTRFSCAQKMGIQMRPMIWGRLLWRKLKRIKIGLHWEAVNALAALGLLLLALYIPFFSDLPDHLRTIAELNTTNRTQSSQVANAQINALRAQQRTNEAISQALNAQSQALSAQAQINSAVVASAAALQHQNELRERAGASEKRVLESEAREIALSKSNQLAAASLESAKAQLYSITDASLSLMYENRFRDFIAQMNAQEGLIIPTNEEISEGQVFESPVFLLLDKEGITLSNDDRAHGQDLGRVFVLALANETKYSTETGFEFSTKQMSSEDPRLRKFIALLRSPLVLDLANYFDFSETLRGLGPAPVTVLDALVKLRSGKSQFAISFVPGKVGEMSYEDFAVRAFWSWGVSNQLGSLGQAGDTLRAKLETFQRSYTGSEDGLKLGFTGAELQSLKKQTEQLFGPEGIAHMQERTASLDKAWLAQLSDGRTQIKPGQHLKMGTGDHVERIFTRVDWNAPLPNQSATLFAAMSEDKSAKYQMACSAARYLDDTKLSRRVEVFSTVLACRNGGGGGVKGGKVFATFATASADDTGTKIECRKATVTVTAPNSYKDEFFLIEGPRSDLCSFPRLVPEGIPLTVTLEYPGMVARPANRERRVSNGPETDSAEFNWRNPVTFSLADHSVRRRVFDLARAR